MKRIIIFISVIVLILCLNLSSYSDEFKIPKEGEIVINEEGYKYEEYLFFPWGTKKGEVMYGCEGGYCIYSPFFKIDNEDNIYVRSRHKTFMKINKAKEIFYINNIDSITGILNNGDIVSGINNVYDSKGNLKYRVALPHVGGELFQDKEGRIYYRHSAYSQFQRFEILKEKNSHGYRKIKYINESLSVPTSQGHCKYLPSSYTNKRFVVKTPSVKDRSYGIKLLQTTTFLKKTILLESNTFVPYLIPKDAKIARIDLISSDTKDNIYCLIYLKNYRNEEGYFFSGLYKFNQEGKLLLFLRPFKRNKTIESQNLIDFNTDNYYQIDRYGNIYQIYISDKGVHIAKWGKGK